MTRTEYNTVPIGAKVQINRQHHDAGKIGIIRKKQYDEIYLEIVEDENDQINTKPIHLILPVHYRMAKIIE